MNTIKSTLASGINALTIFFAKGHTSAFDAEATRLGTNYGGYLIPNEILSSDASRTLISGGLGFDISFDVSLIEFGFEVIGIEPVQQSIDWVRSEIRNLNISDRYSIIPKAISESGDFVEFRPPMRAKNYNWWAIQSDSDVQLKRVRFPCVSVVDLYNMASAQSDIVIGKFDIEGNEMQIIQTILNNGLKFSWLIIEMDYLNLIRTINFPRRIYRTFIAVSYTHLTLPTIYSV